MTPLLYKFLRPPPDLNYAQIAGSLKYVAEIKIWVSEIRPNIFAVWGADATLLLITDDWDEVLIAYKNRPIIARRPLPQVKKYANLNIEITI